MAQNASDTLAPADALAYATRAAYGAARKFGIGASDAAEDIASAVLTVVYGSGDAVTRQSIAAAASIVARNYATGRDGMTYSEGSRDRTDYALAVSADRADADGGTLAETFADTTADPSGSNSAVRTLTTALADGWTISVDTDAHGAIIETARLSHSGTVWASGADALRDAYARTVAPTLTASRGQAVVKATGALARDAAVLSFVGTAADAVLAGLAPTAGAFRAAVCAARKRQNGGTAHSAA